MADGDNSKVIAVDTFTFACLDKVVHAMKLIEQGESRIHLVDGRSWPEKDVEIHKTDSGVFTHLTLRETGECLWIADTDGGNA